MTEIRQFPDLNSILDALVGGLQVVRISALDTRDDEECLVKITNNRDGTFMVTRQAGGIPLRCYPPFTVSWLKRHYIVNLRQVEITKSRTLITQAWYTKGKESNMITSVDELLDFIMESGKRVIVPVWFPHDDIVWQIQRYSDEEILVWYKPHLGPAVENVKEFRWVVSGGHQVSYRLIFDKIKII